MGGNLGRRVGIDEPHRPPFLPHAEDWRELGRAGLGRQRTQGDEDGTGELQHDAIGLGPVAAQVVLGDVVARRG